MRTGEDTEVWKTNLCLEDIHSLAEKVRYTHHRVKLRTRNTSWYQTVRWSVVSAVLTNEHNVAYTHNVELSRSYIKKC